ncbi:hypothetical protein DW352_05155 [Pseudolabrys taiwanensis]|uniref:Terminase small subunit n=1 Tax=Pseudolabrys taiwanensis TaxID=331696 RepID=A0A345ZSR0_9HYPH|nr:terminase small subunit [Pseudolabrys taiwanensis]AXK79957.1 hypothetical protein DW352_05155 [Pseudolabrys taiwanensis]
MDPMPKLRNPRRERFAVEVASMTPVDRAYRLAGFRSAEQWARPNGAKLAQNPEVAARIEELRSEFKVSAGLSVQYLQSCLLPAAEANVVDFFEAATSPEAGNPPKLKSLTKLSRDQGAAISSVRFHEDGTVAELKLVSKEAAIATLMRSIGAFLDRHQVGAAPELLERWGAAQRQLEQITFEDKVALLEVIEELAAPTEPSVSDPSAVKGTSSDDIPR